jgi:hypothetical protein
VAGSLSTRRAKENLADRIVAEAQREGIALSEVERKMLYFSETGWTLPEMAEVNEEFDRDYDQDAYEQKIGGLVCSLRARTDRSEEEIAAWDEAVAKLSDGDHYLLVLITAGEKSASGLRSPWMPQIDLNRARPQGDTIRLILVACAVCVVLFMLLVVSMIFFR